MRLIDADAAKAELLKIGGGIIACDDHAQGIRIGYKRAACSLDTMPVVEERKHGHWLKKHHVSNTAEFTTICCSSCGYKVNFFWNDWRDSKYCPNCGAIMDGVEK